MSQRSGSASQYKALRNLNAKIVKVQYTKEKWSDQATPKELKDREKKLAQEREWRSERDELQVVAGSCWYSIIDVHVYNPSIRAFVNPG